MGKRRRFTAKFKARVALAALREDKTLRQIAAQHGLHPNQVSQWKRQAQEGLVRVFEGRKPATARKAAATTQALHAKIGQLVVERDFLRTALGR